MAVRAVDDIMCRLIDCTVRVVFRITIFDHHIGRVIVQLDGGMVTLFKATVINSYALAVVDEDAC